MTSLILNTSREGYALNQIDHTMTVGELIAFLEDYDEDTKVYLGFDSQYTFGSIREYRFEERDEEDEDE